FKKARESYNLFYSLAGFSERSRDPADVAGSLEEYHLIESILTYAVPPKIVKDGDDFALEAGDKKYALSAVSADPKDKPAVTKAQEALATVQALEGKEVRVEIANIAENKVKINGNEVIISKKLSELKEFLDNVEATKKKVKEAEASDHKEAVKK